MEYRLVISEVRAKIKGLEIAEDICELHAHNVLGDIGALKAVNTCISGIQAQRKPLQEVLVDLETLAGQ